MGTIIEGLIPVVPDSGVTADWARSVVRVNTKKKEDELLVFCLNTIRQAVNGNKTNCDIYKQILPAVSNELVKRGFTVRENPSQKDGESFRINW